MNQVWLFQEAAAEREIRPLKFRPDFESWQLVARRQLRQRVPPEAIWWQPDAPGVATAPEEEAVPQAPASVQVRVPRVFVEQAKAAACHRNADRWDLLYRILWRLVGDEKHVLELHGDPQVLKLNQYVRTVHREVHKMKAFVRFREVKGPDGGDDLRYVAWFEPEHHVVRYGSDFFRRRFSGMRWSILTPDACAHYEGAGDVWFTGGVRRQAGPDSDGFEDAWRLYYRSIFNPARLKVRAMLAEMPRRYWKNLPEAQLIPSLIHEADRRLDGMQALSKSVDESRCGPRPAAPAAVASARLATVEQGSLEHLALQASACRRCRLWEPATQTVWGEGPADARIMLVGEQPGDQEDLLGRPFVGPAGRLLDRALAQAGIDRKRLYLTNAVKHFKFKSRGKRRLHEKPLDMEVMTCLPWLQAELARVRPRLVVCLGATAARALTGRPVRITHERGSLLEPAARESEGRVSTASHQSGSDQSDSAAPRILLTYHPSYLLRLQDTAAAADAYQEFVADLMLASRTAADGPAALAALAALAEDPPGTLSPP